MNRWITPRRTFSSMMALAYPLFAMTQCNSPTNSALQPVGVEMEMLFIELPEPVALELVPDFQNQSKAKPAMARLEKLIVARKATVWGWITLTTKSGQRAVTEQINEVRYATEFDPPRIDPGPKPNADPLLKPAPTVDVSAFDAVPTAFETRNCGLTFEVEPVIGPDGETIDINLVPQHVRLIGFKKTIIEKQPAGTKSIIEQPEFHTLKVTTSLTMKSGEVRLIGVFKAPESADRMELFILRATVRSMRIPKSDGTRSSLLGRPRGVVP